MRKSIRIYGIILLILIISGCSSGEVIEKELVIDNSSQIIDLEESNKGENNSTKNNETESTIRKTVDYKVELGTLENLPGFFVLRSFFDENYFLGETTAGTCIYSVADEQYNIISDKRYWEYQVSPNKEQVLASKDGVYSLLDLQTGNKSKDFDLGIYGCLECDYSLDWGTDSTLILREYSEWTLNHYTLDIETSEIEYIDTKLDGYFLPYYIKWIDENKLLFSVRANIKKDGTSEYTHGYRQDMAIYNTNTKEFSKITDANDGEFYDFIGNKDNNLYLRKTILLDEIEKIEYYKLDLDTGEIHKLNENNEIIAILDEDNYIIIDQLEEQEGFTMYHIKGQDKYEIATWYKEYWPSYVEAYLFPNKLYLLYNSDILYYSIDN